VLSQFGFHLIQVQERSEDRVTARHILIPAEPSEEAQDALYAQADSLEALARRGGLQRAARATGAEMRNSVTVSTADAYVPGIGSLVEVVEWAAEEHGATDAQRVSPVFETPEAFYVVEVDAYNRPGMLSLADATPEIRRQIILEKKREQARQIGQQMAAEVRGGRTLEQVAQERGLVVEQAGPFTRTGFNPAFGQANAVTGAAFGVPIGQVSNVLATPGGLFLIRPVERTTADREQFEAEKEQLRQIAQFQLQQEALARWMEGLRRDAEIVDRRRDVMARS
jgi:peptidyl-prolyl cis-trans isomerase D